MITYLEGLGRDWCLAVAENMGSARAMIYMYIKD